MILSVSRRTDIPAFYSEWFFNRVKEGYACVRNPMNKLQVSKIPINPDIVDCIVFWTKNPQPMLSQLDKLRDFNYYFQFTVNPYDKNIETSVPKKGQIIDTFKRLSDKIGSKRMVWRYDPILLTDKIGVDYHTKYFEAIAKRLASYTERCTISFIDSYKKIERDMERASIRAPHADEIMAISKSIAEIAKTYGIEVQTCAEKYDLSCIGIKHGKCIDEELIEEIIGYPIVSRKDKNQRKECGCIESVDIGEYNTCGHNCLYCYANRLRQSVLSILQKHNATSPVLIGDVANMDVVGERKCVSLKSCS